MKTDAIDVVTMHEDLTMRELRQCIEDIKRLQEGLRRCIEDITRLQEAHRHCPDCGSVLENLNFCSEHMVWTLLCPSWLCDSREWRFSPYTKGKLEPGGHQHEVAPLSQDSPTIG